MEVRGDKGGLTIRLSAEEVTRVMKEDDICLDGLTLTPRQRDVFDLVRRNLSNKEIAVALHVEETTVKAHLVEVYRRIAVETRSELLFKYGYKSSFG